MLVTPPAGLTGVPVAVLVELAVKSSVILLLALGLAPFLQRGPAAARHALWAGALTAVLLLPLLMLILPVWSVTWLPVRGDPAAEVAPVTPPASNPIEASAPETPTRLVAVPTVRQKAPAATALPTKQATPSVKSPPPAMAIAPAIPPRPGLISPVQTTTFHKLASQWVGAIWLLGMGLMLVPLVVGWMQAERLTNRSRWLATPAWDMLLGKVTRELRPSGAWLLAAPGNIMPFTWGVWRPVVIFPESAADWPEERRRAVLRHELGHVARHDWLMQTLGALACAVYWFNPLVWLVARRMRFEREQACDDLVLGSGQSPQSYAHALLDMACLVAPTGALGVAAVPMARAANLEARLRSILDPRRNRAGPSRQFQLSGLALMVVVMVPLAMLHASAPAAPGPDANLAGTVNPSADIRLTEACLGAVITALDQASASLHGAAPATHGGFVEKGLQDLTQARAAAVFARDLAHDNPALDAEMVAASPTTDALMARLNAVIRGSNPQPNMYLAIGSLRRAVVALKTVPGGDLDRSRESLVALIDHATSDVLAGIQFAEVGNRATPNRSTRPPPPSRQGSGGGGAQGEPPTAPVGPPAISPAI